jgi:alkanesulfonate monooxygenase SsuD/methylene tetrahydromethanopterin reductase-like flavin-dependent oxidoreductase (luciferase family)
MRNGIFLPPFGEFANPRRVAALAASAEAAGWDGLFLWDHILAAPGVAVAEAWTTLAAIAMTTTRIRFGALVTPLARRRPWAVARQIATLDQLSDGRLIVGVGLGDDGWREFSAFGEETSPAGRGELLDESLELVVRFLAGDDVSFRGARFVIDAGPLLPRPVQDPVPIWAAVRWPNTRPLERAARLHGSFPIFPADTEVFAQPSVADLAALREKLTGLGAPRSHDLVVCISADRLTKAEQDEAARALAEAGVTWLLASFGRQPAAEVEAEVRAGPPDSSGRLGR